MKKTHIVLHHTAMYAEDDVADQFDKVDNSHKNRWQGKTKSAMGYYGGYTYIIERSGAVQQFRNDWETGAHCREMLMNYRSIGISFAGNMSRQELTGKQIEAAMELINRLQAKHSIPVENILPHRHYKATQCPGNNIDDKAFEYLKEQYRKITEDKEQPIVKWHKKHKIIEHWSMPPTAAEIKQGWIAYKTAKAMLKLKDNDFNL